MDESLKVAREKHWSEITDGEKVERMRGIIKQLSSELDFLRNRLGSLEDHAHVGDKIYCRREGFGYGVRVEGHSQKNNDVFF